MTGTFAADVHGSMRDRAVMPHRIFSGGIVGVYACLGATCYLHFWQNNRDLLLATAVTQGMEQTPNKSQQRKLTLEKKLLPLPLPGFKLATFRS